MWPLIALAGAQLVGGLAANRKAKQRDRERRAQNAALAAPLVQRATELQGPGRQSLTNLQGMAIRAAQGGRGLERSALLNQNVADVGMAVGRQPTSLNGVLDRALTRAKGVSRLARYTSDQFDNSMLRERMGLVQQGRQRQATSLHGVLDSIGLRAGTLAAGAASRESAALGRENLLGTLTGLGVGAIPDIQAWNQRRKMMNASQEAGGTPVGNGYYQGLS